MLGENTTCQDLRITLKVYGGIENVQLIIGIRNLYAFVTFENIAGAIKAEKDCTELLRGSQQIIVKFSINKAFRHVENLYQT